MTSKRTENDNLKRAVHEAAKRKRSEEKVRDLLRLRPREHYAGDECEMTKRIENYKQAKNNPTVDLRRKPQPIKVVVVPGPDGELRSSISVGDEEGEGA